MPEIVYRHSFPFREAMAALLGADQIDAESYEIRVIGGCVVVDLVNPSTAQREQDHGHQVGISAGEEGQAAHDVADDGAQVAAEAQSEASVAAETAKPIPEPNPELKGGARAKKAGMLCADKGFQTFMDAATADEAAAELRSACGVTSRAMLDHDEGAGKKFDEINRRYGLWTQGYDV